MYIYLLHLIHHGTLCLFSSYFFVANLRVAVRALHRSAAVRAVPEIERFGGLAHAARLGLFKFNIKMRQAAGSQL
jgi:hypothetical protein